MGRAPQSEKKINDKKKQILKEALEIIEKDGYEGFSIRKLGPRLGVAPKTIYNYFHNKDEIYLHILTKGFAILNEDLQHSVYRIEDPYLKLAALSKAFIQFGFIKKNYYDLMLTLHVPKYNDYIGTPQESLASLELETAMSSANQFIQAIEAIAITYGQIDIDDANLRFIQLFVGMHGIISLKNNTILDYLHKDPDLIIAPLLEGLLAPFKP